jgi:hypothetical protein
MSKADYQAFYAQYRDQHPFAKRTTIIKAWSSPKNGGKCHGYRKKKCNKTDRCEYVVTGLNSKGWVTRTCKKKSLSAIVNAVVNELPKAEAQAVLSKAVDMIPQAPLIVDQTSFADRIRNSPVHSKVQKARQVALMKAAQAKLADKLKAQGVPAAEAKEEAKEAVVEAAASGGLRGLLGRIGNLGGLLGSG